MTKTKKKLEVENKKHSEDNTKDSNQNNKEDKGKKKGKPSKVSSGSISMYLAEIGRFNPLPPEREV